MKKFLLTLAAVALACSAMMAQTNVPTPVQEEPDRIQNRHLSKNPTGMDVPTGYDKAQTVADKKDCCKDKKEGQACNKPADQQCPDCKAKAAAAQQCKKAEGKQCDKAAAGHECKKAEGMKCDKAAAGHECKKAEGMKKCDKAAAGHECKKAEGMKCDKAAAGHECKKAEGMKKCDKAAAGHECKKAEAKKDCCKDKKEGQACNKPADQQCPDCKAKAAAKKN